MKPQNNRTLILAASDVQEIIKYCGLNAFMDRLTDKMSAAFRNFSPEHTSIPARSGFSYEKPFPGLIEWMPLMTNGEQAMIKIVGYHPSNPIVNGFPTIISSISLYDTSSGHLEIIIDGVLLTALRTGAASAVASKLMARPDSRNLGLIGCGAQAVTQLHGLSRLFNFENVFIYDTDSLALDSFPERVQALQLESKLIPGSLEEVVANSDILVTATSIENGEGPLFEELETRDWLHVNAVGSDFPGKIELPLAFLRKSFVCPDFLDQALVEGECQQLEAAEIGPEIVELAKFPDKYQHLKNQRTVFDSTGWALEDHVALQLLSDLAAELGLGNWVELEYLPEDARSPYRFLAEHPVFTHSK